MFTIANLIRLDSSLSFRRLGVIQTVRQMCAGPKSQTEERPSSTTTPARLKLKPRKRRKIEDGGPDLFDFMASQGANSRKVKMYPEIPPYIDPESLRADGAKVYLDVYGCQMNVSDTEVVLSVLEEQGYVRTLKPEEADAWLIVTCSIREGAETKIWQKLRQIQKQKQTGLVPKNMSVGVLGCMAERLKTDLLEASNVVDIVAGPDSYKDLPRLLAVNRSTGQAAINVMLSQDETYSDLTPVRLSKDSVTAFLSIQRGCDNMCSYCIVPFTRGRERSRPITTILDEVRGLSDQGVKEITLLGQNVNSYRDTSSKSLSLYNPRDCAATRQDFKTVYKTKEGGLRFVDLLDQVSLVNPEVRIRFTSPHPKDFPEEVLQLIKERDNICNQIHLPAQCGSDRVLENMKRGYTIESYLELVQSIRDIIPGVGLTSDFIVGFCGETEAEFQMTLDLIRKVKYNKCFMFPYSLREKTGAHRKLQDDVPEHVKKERHHRIAETFRSTAMELHESYIGSVQKVLVTGDSKRSDQDFQGTCDMGVKVIFPKALLSDQNGITREVKPGDFVNVKITSTSSETFKGTSEELTTLSSDLSTIKSSTNIAQQSL
eukprot:TRINITY_DN26714_c0_g1_i4.p1 TRINITY_DN26714_c0_g1~~TRINITY_DN26714_c0_g1_i4.p1  ORF type:complete len:610 (+),score=75.62 TRINITY_DN26714_c0_g1_i4:33-1832(+)